MDTTRTASTVRPATTVRPVRVLLAAGGLLLEAVAVGAVLIDARHLASIAWIPGWVGAALALLQVRAGRGPRLLAVATAVLFVVGTVLGIAAAVSTQH